MKFLLSNLIILFSIIGLTINISNMEQRDFLFNFDWLSFFFYLLFSYILLGLFLISNNFNTKSNFAKLNNNELFFKYSLSFSPFFIMYISLLKFWFSPQSSNPPQFFSLTIGIALFSSIQIYYWINVFKNNLNKISSFINKYFYHFIFVILIIYSITNFLGSYISYLIPTLNDFDTWLHFNTIYNTSVGNIGKTSLLLPNHTLLFEHHFYYIIILFGWIYKIYSDPIIIFIITQLCNVVAGYYFFKICYHYFDNYFASLFLMLAFLSNFIIQYSGYVVFRVEFIAPLFIVIMFYAFINKQSILFFISFVLFASLKESSFIFLIFFCFSLYLLTYYKKYLFLSIFSLFLLLFWMLVLQPYLSPNYHSLDMHYGVSGTSDFFCLLLV